MEYFLLHLSSKKTPLVGRLTHLFTAFSDKSMSDFSVTRHSWVFDLEAIIFMTIH